MERCEVRTSAVAEVSRRRTAVAVAVASPENTISGGVIAAAPHSHVGGGEGAAVPPTALSDRINGQIAITIQVARSHNAAPQQAFGQNGHSCTEPVEPLGTGLGCRTDSLTNSSRPHSPIKATHRRPFAMASQNQDRLRTHFASAPLADHANRWVHFSSSPAVLPPQP